MKCEACAAENIFGSKICKACGSSLNRAESGGAIRPAAPAVRAEPSAFAAPVAASAPLATSEAFSGAPETAAPGDGGADYKELDFIPYTGNAYFNHFVHGLRHALDFKGRTARAGFWYFTLFQFLIVLVFQVTFTSLADLAFLILLVPTVSIWFRRLHDTGRSAWWLLLAFIPFVQLALIYFAAQAGQPQANTWGPEALVNH